LLGRFDSRVACVLERFCLAIAFGAGSRCFVVGSAAGAVVRALVMLYGMCAAFLLSRVLSPPFFVLDSVCRFSIYSEDCGFGFVENLQKNCDLGRRKRKKLLLD
jgi:hypothetical protein